MEQLNICFFIDIESCLISGRGERGQITGLTDWKFNDPIIEYIIKNKIEFVCLIADKPVNLILNKRRYERFISLVQKQLQEIVKAQVSLLYYNIADTYYNYPNPGGIFNFCIENDVDLSRSIYVSDDEDRLKMSCAGIAYKYHKFLLIEL